MLGAVQCTSEGQALPPSTELLAASTGTPSPPSPAPCWMPPSCLGFGGAAGAPLGFSPPYVDVSMANSPTSRGRLPVWVPLCSLSSLPIITASGHTPEHLFPSQKLFSALLLVGGESSYYLQSRVCSMGRPGQQPAGHKTPSLHTNSLQKNKNKNKKRRPGEQSSLQPLSRITAHPNCGIDLPLSLPTPAPRGSPPRFVLAGGEQRGTGWGRRRDEDANQSRDAWKGFSGDGGASKTPLIIP